MDAGRSSAGSRRGRSRALRSADERQRWRGAAPKEGQCGAWCLPGASWLPGTRHPVAGAMTISILARGSMEQPASARLVWCRACRRAALVIIKAQGKATQRGRCGLRQQCSSRMSSSRATEDQRRSSRSRHNRMGLEGQSRSSRTAVERQQCSRAGVKQRQSSSRTDVEVDRSAAERRHAACYRRERQARRETERAANAGVDCSRRGQRYKRKPGQRRRDPGRPRWSARPGRITGANRP